MIRNALDQAGGEAYLLTQARENPASFLTLVGKVIPQQVEQKTEVQYVARLPTPVETVDEWLKRSSGNHSPVPRLT